MPYPLPAAAIGSAGARVRLLPPLGCPGAEQWVLPMDLPGWLELGYRRGPVPQGDLELFWLPAPLQGPTAAGSVGIELLANPRRRFGSSFSVDWGDGSHQVIPWPALSRSAPRLRHLYSHRADLLVRVQLGESRAELPVALLSCPRLSSRGSRAAAVVLEPLLPGSGISGEAYDGRGVVVWQLRLHPNGGLALLPDPASGEPALGLLPGGAGGGSRGTRVYGGNGPPPQSPTELEPPAAAGDFYLDRLSGQLYELQP